MKLINPEVRIENCSTCNSKCTICPREKMTRPKVVMPQGHFEYLVDQAKGLGAKLISIFGYGEPLMDKGIVKKVSYCTDNGLDTFITTNASLLKVDMTEKLLKAGLKKIRFSVHGMYNQYDEVHVGLEWYDTIRNIGNFYQVAKTKFPGQCNISVSVIPKDANDLGLIKYFWREFDLEIWRPHNWTDGRLYRELTPARLTTCGRPFTGPVQINADGKMMVCCFDFDAKMTVGDTYHDFIEDILKSDKYESIRQCHRMGNLDTLPCKTCDQLNVGDEPLLYSTVDKDCNINKTSSLKFDITCNDCCN